jgi:ferredoxin
MKVFDATKLSDVAAALQAAGYRVVAPIEDGDVVRLKEWTPGASIRPDVIPVNSAKDVLLPPSEVIGRTTFDGNDFTPQDVPVEAPRTVLLAVRPCDAAAMALLDTVFNWDYKDEFYNARREATTVAPVACTSTDDQCFCTSVGGAPDSKAGADAILRPADGGTKFIVEPITEKGKAMLAAAGGTIADGNAKADPPAAVPRRFDAKAVTAWLADHFEDDLWATLGLGCLGCGACTYACPTCHCFDIQDEATRREGVRLRNWDSCGFGQFTLHASGHNPRALQSARWRNRVMHKFSYIPQRFQMLGCTGCGRCARLCGAGMSMAEVCRLIDQESRKAAAK